MASTYLVRSGDTLGRIADFHRATVGWCFYNLFIFQRFPGRRGSAKPVELSRDC